MKNVGQIASHIHSVNPMAWCYGSVILQLNLHQNMYPTATEVRNRLRTARILIYIWSVQSDVTVWSAWTSKHDTKWQRDHHRYSYFLGKCTLKYVPEKSLKQTESSSSYLLNRLIIRFSEQCVLRCLVPCHFHAQRPRCVNSKPTCAHLCAPGSVGLKVRCGQARRWRIAILRRQKDHQKNGRKSKAQSVSCYLTFFHKGSNVLWKIPWHI